ARSRRHHLGDADGCRRGDGDRGGPGPRRRPGRALALGRGGRRRRRRRGAGAAHGRRAHRAVNLPYELFLAVRYLRVHRGRTFLSPIPLISVAGVAVGAAALVIALALMTGLQDDVRNRVLGGSAHLTVVSADAPAITAVPPLLD